MRKVFISYRRSEAEYIAGSLARDLRRQFGEEQIFLDKEDIAGGVSWREKVLNEIDRHSAVLLLLNKDWVNIRDENGQRRIDKPDDPARLELVDALKDGAKIIPVLLENAQMPSEQDLPPELRPLADINALKLRDAEWQFDLDRLCNTLEASGFQRLATPESFTTPASRPAPSPPRNKISRFVQELVRQHVICPDLESAYADMAKNKEREQEAMEWTEAFFKDIAIRKWPTIDLTPHNVTQTEGG